jgi:acetyl esterase/lipase
VQIGPFLLCVFRVEAVAVSFHCRAMFRIFISAWIILTTGLATAAALPPVELWPGTPPGEQKALGEEKDLSKPTDGLVAGKPVIRLGNVSKPTLQVFTPPQGQANGSAVLVCPGGGYHILAMDLEGTEVCEWLNSIGVTAVLLKYRVPRREGSSEGLASIQDAQRALGLTRLNAKSWGINPDRIGVMGFSAGGHLSARLSNNFRERSYPAVDDADRVSCRPDFTLLIYPAYLTDKDKGDQLRPEMPVSNQTPPTFLAISQDDPVRVENALHYSIALQASKVPLELHIYPKGGHGYGLRRTEENVTSWPDRAADWMRGRGLLRAN